MSNFTRYFPSGFIGPAQIPGAFVDAVDSSLPKAPNFTDGSDHDAGAVVKLGGAGMLFSGILRIDPSTYTITILDAVDEVGGGDTTVNIDATSGSTTVNFNGASECAFGASSLLSIGGTAIVQASASLDFAGSATFTMQGGSNAIVTADNFLFDGDTVEYEANLAFRSGCDPLTDSGCMWTWQSGSGATFDAGSTIDINGAANVNGAVTQGAASTITQQGKFVRSGTTARSRIRVQTLANNASHTLDVSYDHYFYEQTSATNRTLTIRETSAPVPEDGETLTITVLNSSANTVGVQREGMAGISTLIVGNAGVNFTCELVYSAAAARWRVRQAGRSDGLGGDLTFGGDA